MFYYFAKYILWVILNIFCKIEVEGLENIPKEGPVVVVANHRSFWDPVVLGIILNRKVFMMAKEELFNIPILKNIIRGMGAFPVKRGKPDRNALRIAAKILEDGSMLGLFPEGTRSQTDELLPAQPGAALFAMRSKAPILPIGLNNTKAIFKKFRPSVVVNIGNVLVYPEIYDSKASSEDLEIVSQDMMKSIKKLLI